MKDQLFHYASVRHDDWDLYLHTVMQSYNSTVNVATGYTPHYAMFGREMQTPEMTNEEERKKLAEGLEEGWVETMVDRLHYAWSAISERAHKNWLRGNRSGRSSSIEGCNRIGKGKSRAHEFKEYKVGDYFYRKRNPMREFKSVSDQEKYKIAMKLQARYEGPYQVTERINPVLYGALVCGKTVVVHAVNMKPQRGSRPMQVSVRGEVQQNAVVTDVGDEKENGERRLRKSGGSDWSEDEEVV